LTQPTKLKSQASTKTQNQDQAIILNKKAQQRIKVTSVLSDFHSPSNLKTESTTRDKSASKTQTTNDPKFRSELINQYQALILKTISKQQLEKAARNFIIKD